MSPRQWGMSDRVSPGTPFTTTTTAPSRVSAAPTVSRRDRRSPSSSGASTSSVVGSTVMRSAALLAVECARPQLPNAKASAKPTTPMRATRTRSAGAPRRPRRPADRQAAQPTSTTAPISTRASPSVAGPMSASTIRLTE